jgi:uncharacterized Tic20 family protein
MSDPMENTPPPMTSGSSEDERMWAMFAHLSALLGGLLTGAFGGWGSFLGPLVIWLVKKDTMPFVDSQGKEALNFNITLAIIFLSLTIFSVVTLGIGLLIAVPVGIIVGIGALVLIVIASIKAKEGVAYRYPLTLRLVK